MIEGIGEAGFYKNRCGEKVEIVGRGLGIRFDSTGRAYYQEDGASEVERDWDLISKWEGK